MGDSSDNIPGVAGIGPKNCQEVVKTVFRDRRYFSEYR
ncbi:MAG: hypothetical protein U5N58_04685 [Actinomycetota bacterium]|nr:hypothetical protein [Actinomycetota bacterium]